MGDVNCERAGTWSLPESLTNCVSEKTVQSVISHLTSVLTVVLVFILSIFFYGTFYYSYTTTPEYEIPLHLQFKPCNGSEDSQTRCSFPTGHLRLGRRVNLVQGQAYSILSRLNLPDSESNEEHGMFMTCLTLTTGDGVRVEQSCKSAILEYRSPLQKMINTLVFTPLLLTGISKQHQQINIHFFQNFQLDSHQMGEIFTLDILSRQLEISQASIAIFAELTGDFLPIQVVLLIPSIGRTEVPDVPPSLDIRSTGGWDKPRIPGLHPPHVLLEVPFPTVFIGPIRNCGKY